MNTSIIIDNLLHPPVLFFFLGMIASFCKSDLKIPEPLPKLFSLYLLFAIGFHGGVELHKTGINHAVLVTLGAAILMAAIIPVYAFFILKIKLDAANAAAIAATYGSISAVTFITAITFLETSGMESGGYMVAALALMESPAIVIGIVLYKLFDKQVNKDESSASEPELHGFSWFKVLHEAFLNGSVLLITGSLFIGLVSGEKGWDTLSPFAKDIFKGMLSFFLLDMGIIAAKRIGDVKNTGIFLPAFSIIIPVVNACIGISIAKLIGLNMADALVFSVLCASASYIAVPAAMRMSIPDANPRLYIPMALAITLPFNSIVGIPLYFYLITLFWK